MMGTFRLPIDLLIVLAVLISASVSCRSWSRDPGITAITLRGQTGLLGQSFQIEFKDDGSTAIECNFYEVNEEGKPRMDAKLVCDDLLRKLPGSFRVSSESGRKKLNGNLQGSVSSETFRELADSVKNSGFFKMADGYEFTGKTDSPPDFVVVKYAGGTKEVGEKAQENERFSALKSKIYSLAESTHWNP